MTSTRLALIIAALGWTAGSLALPLYANQSSGQPAPPPPSPAQPAAAPGGEPETKPPAAAPEAQPSLDELLGISPDRPPSALPEGDSPPAAADPVRTALERKLTAREVSEQFEQAVQLMGDAAQRLNISRDTGIDTQRMQDEIIRKLDMLIQSAQQQRQQSRSSSSSSQSRDPSQQPAQPQGQSQVNEGGQASDPQSEAMPPGNSGAQPSPDVAARGAAWGSLPERVRDALLQGNADQYSSLYQRWTEAYYRRLAEEANR
jgi:hypothetical protein